jgi:hypothetical protein
MGCEVVVGAFVVRYADGVEVVHDADERTNFAMP